MRWAVNCVVLVALAGLVRAGSDKPHIVFFLWDDQGYGDVSYTGRTDISSPLLDEYARKGRILERHYTSWLCTPSRASLMTGRNPITLGIQHDIFSSNTEQCLDNNLVMWPNVLRANGYKTHMVGKWHLGYASWPCTPCDRGFDTAMGYMSGSENWLTHVVGSYYDFYECKGSDKMDWRELTELYGTYANYVYRDRLLSIVEEHDDSQPLLLYITMQSVHSPYYAPRNYYSSACKTTSKRCTMQAMISAGEDVMRSVIGKLQDKGMWDDTLLVYASDNGGPGSSYHSNGFLRGSKGTLWEGGVRTPSFIYSPNTNLVPSGTSTQCLFHVSDWYPTLIQISGGWENFYDTTGVSASTDIDGVDQSSHLLSNGVCPRNNIFINVDPVKRVGAYIKGHLKLLVGNQGASGTCVSGREYPLDGNAMDDSILALYNITSDPSESMDLSKVYPDVTSLMLGELKEYSLNQAPLMCEFEEVPGSYPNAKVPFIIPWQFS